MANEILKDIVRTIVCGTVDKIDVEKQMITFCISSEELDRHNEIVTSAAMKDAIPAFATNPIACPCHLRVLSDGTPPTVGRWDIESFRQTGKKSYMDLYFSQGKLGQAYWAEYRDGNMKACSISFRPKEWHEEKTNKNGYTVIFDKMELTEISLVAIGSCRSALAKELGLSTDPDGEYIKTIDEKLKPLHEKLDQMLSLIEEHIDTTSDRCDFGDELLAFGNKPSNPNKSIAEPEIDAESAKRLVDKINAIAR